MTFLVLSVSFFDLDKEKIQGCRNLNLTVQQKDVKKNTLEQFVFASLDFDSKNLHFYRKDFGNVGKTGKMFFNNCFFIFFGLWQDKLGFWPDFFWQACRICILRVQRNTYWATFQKGVPKNFRNVFCIFTGRFLERLSELLSTCPEEHLQRNIFRRKSWKLEDFWIFSEVFGTMAKNLFKDWQNSNRCPGEQFMEKPFSKEKNSLFFPILFVKQLFFHLLWTLTRQTWIFTGKLLAGLSNLQSTCPKKHFLSNVLEKNSEKIQVS